MVGETMVLPGRAEGRPRWSATQAGRQVDGLWSRACEHIAGGPRAVLGRNGTFEGALQAEARPRRVVGRCGTAQQLMGQSDLALAFDEAGWQVPSALSCQAGPGRFVWLVSLPPSPSPSQRHSSLHCRTLPWAHLFRPAPPLPATRLPSQVSHQKRKAPLPTWQPHPHLHLAGAGSCYYCPYRNAVYRVSKPDCTSTTPHISPFSLRRSVVPAAQWTSTSQQNT